MSATASCECGWTGRYTSPAKAEYAARRHSCARQRIVAERRERVARRLAAVGPTRECAHKIACHQHGTHAAYVRDRCRCRRCKDANAAYEHKANRLRAYGWTPYVDAGPARAHVLSLREQGMGPKRISAVSGIAHGVLAKLVYGDKARGSPPSRRVRRETEAKILAVELDLGATVVVDGTGTYRRLQALVARGWSQSKLAQQLGIDPTNIGPIVYGLRPPQVATVRAVRSLYERLWDKPPPESTHRDKIAASRARRQAEKHGWVPPLAWDDDAIDDPTATAEILEDADPVVDQVLIDRAIAGEQVNLSRTEKLEAVRRLALWGKGASAISRRLHLSGSTARDLYAKVQPGAEVEVSA